MNRARGVPALLLVVMMAWGLNIPAVKALTGVIDVVWVGIVRLCAAALVLTICLLVRDRRLPRLGVRNWLVLTGIAALTIYANQLLFVRGMRLTSASNAALTMSLMPLLALTAGALLLRERVAWRSAVGLALGFAGVAVVVLQAPNAGVSMPGAGELFLVGGLLAFVIGGLLIQRAVRELDVLVIGWATYCSGSLMLLVHGLVGGGLYATMQAFDAAWVWLCVLYSGVLGTALSNVGWYHAIGRIGQTRASPYFYWLAVFGVLFSALMLGEPLVWWHAMGLAMVVAGVRLGARRAPALAESTGASAGSSPS